MRTTTLTLKRAKRLRDNMTRQELGLWLYLKNRQLGGFKFRRQHPVGPYILDFYCAELRLAVEIDGEVHGHPDQVAHDQRRDAFHWHPWTIHDCLGFHWHSCHHLVYRA